MRTPRTWVTSICALALAVSVGCSRSTPLGGSDLLDAGGAPALLGDAGGADAGASGVDSGFAALDAGSGDGGGGVGDAGTSGDAGSTGDAGFAGDAGNPPTPFVAIADGGLFIGGKQVFLFGGDLHYFRVRDANFDAGVTYAMWGETLDLMADAGMNYVTTYVPWDYHNPSAGQWDFTGAKDLGHFLQMACDKGFYVTLKPGPLITAEWPDGWGTFGAIPLWWKQAHPEAMILNSSGAVWTYSPTGDSTQLQPTYLHPEYLAAVADYYQHVLPIAQPFLGRCLIGLQIDNETNLYWGKHFGDVDYSPTALAFYQAWLATEYGNDIATLNAFYGTTYASFADVVAPSAVPDNADHSGNIAATDWYWAGQAYVAAYLTELQGFAADAGFGPDQLLHFTNDSPFAASYGTIQLQATLLHDPATKAPFGVPSLDLYPKQEPTSSALQDQPFQADYFTRFWELQHLKGQPAQGFPYAAELQGGWFSYPVIGAPNVQPADTDQLLARTIGHGLKSGAFYVIRGGLNADNSDYDYEAAISEDGGTRPRYQVMRTWGTFLQSYGVDLQGASEVQNSVAILDNAAYAAPQGGIEDNMQLLRTAEQPALYGWLMNAGIDPAILDAQSVSAAELAAYKVVFFQNPDFVDDATSALLANYVAQGGLLVNLLWPGEYNDLWQSSPASQYLSTVVFPAQADSSYVWATNTARTGTFNAAFGSFSGQLTSCWYESFWSDPAGTLQPFAWEEQQPLGGDGRIVGYLASDGVGKRVFLGTNVFSLYNRGDQYYGMAPAALNDNAALAQWLVGLGGEAPIVSISPQELVWARRTSARTYLFVIDDSGTAATQTITLGNAAALGINTAVTYNVEELLSGTALGTFSGATLAAKGLSVTLAAYGTAVIAVQPQ